MKWIRKSLILIHRYLGIVLSLLFVVWFLSGIGMGGSPRCLLDVPLGIQPFFILAIRCIVASGIFRVSLYMPADVIGDFLVNFFAFQLDYEEVVAGS